MALADLVPPGVVTGSNLRKLYTHARDNGYAIPSFRCSSTKGCNAVLEAARQSCSPVAIRVTCAAGVAVASPEGKQESRNAVDNTNNPQQHDAGVAGAVALAYHVHTMAPHYGVVVVLESETRCLHQLVTWYEALLTAQGNREPPLYSSHLLDVTKDVANQEELLAIASQYLKRLDQYNIWLEVKVNPTCIDDATISEEVQKTFQTLSQISPNFSIALNALPSSSIRSEGNMFLVLDDEIGILQTSNIEPARIVQVNMNHLDQADDKENCSIPIKQEDIASGCARIMKEANSKDHYICPT